MAQGFRIAGTLNEFFNDLDRLKNSQHKLIIWQNNYRNEKIIVEGIFNNYGQEKGNTYIFFDLEKTLAFIKDNPVYIFEKAEGILFKGRFEHCVNNSLKVLADNKVFLREKREERRFYFLYTKVTAVIELHMKSTDSHVAQKIILHDITPDGFAFLLTNDQLKDIRTKDQIELCGIHGIKFPQPLSGEIVHISEAKNTTAKVQGSKLVGVKFTNSSKLIEIVINEMKKEEARQENI